MSKQGCDNHCETCNSANHAYCAVMLSKTNQKAIMEMRELLQAMRETKVYIPIREGIDNVPESE
jgi:hypothetical protein